MQTIAPELPFLEATESPRWVDFRVRYSPALTIPARISFDALTDAFGMSQDEQMLDVLLRHAEQINAKVVELALPGKLYNDDHRLVLGPSDF